MHFELLPENNEDNNESPSDDETTDNVDHKPLPKGDELLPKNADNNGTPKEMETAKMK